MTREKKVKTAKAAQPPDAVLKAINRARAAALAAQREGYGDTRTSMTVCTDYIDRALKDLDEAAKWLREYNAEERAAERAVEEKPKPKPAECAVCGEEVAPDDVSYCEGCSGPVCPECIDDGVCSACREEAE